jgi:hypothetical protein
MGVYGFRVVYRPMKTLQSIFTLDFLKFVPWTIQFEIGIPCLVILTNILTRCLALR